MKVEIVVFLRSLLEEDTKRVTRHASSCFIKQRLVVLKVNVENDEKAIFGMGGLNYNK